MDDQKDAIRAVARPSPDANRQQLRDVIAIGGSAGALEALLDIVGAMPDAFSGNLFVVSHIGANPSHLPELLNHAGTLPAGHAEDGEPVRPGRVYIAPPDRHMLVEDGRIRLSRGPRQHFTRPAIDPLFYSAAECFGPRLIGVVLSGAGSDGAAGLDKIRRAGGITVVQDPATALYPDMPRRAAAAVQVDHVAGKGELPALLRRLSSENVTMKSPPIAHDASTNIERIEQPIALTCPECGGALREAGGPEVKQYRCHIGHRFAPEEVLEGQVEEVEHALGVGMRVLNERVELCRQMMENARVGGRAYGVEHWRRMQREAQEQLQVLQQFLARAPSVAALDEDDATAKRKRIAPQPAKA